jgi:hypothetical protein
MIRKALSLLAALSLSSLAHTAQAQLGVYGTFSVNRLSVPAFQTTGVSGVETKSSVDPIGGTFGAYYDFKTYGPVRLGVDVRGVDVSAKQQGIDNFNGCGTRIYSALGGVRGSFRPLLKVIQPYAQMSAGLGRTTHAEPCPNATGGPIPVSNNVEYHAFAGADIHLLPFLDFRAIELGYGGLSIGGTAGTPSLKSLSSGLVFHFSR